MTEIFLLHPYDNADSVLDKMGLRFATGSNETRYLLVFPKRGRVLSEPLEFARARAWGDFRGLTIGICAQSDIIQIMAKRQRMPVFKTRQEAESAPWSVKRHDFPKRTKEERADELHELLRERERTQPFASPRGVLRLFIFLCALSSAFLIFYLIFPHAVIYVVPQRIKQTIELPLWTSDQLNALTITGGVPSREEILTLNLSATVPSTGLVQSVPTLATGFVRLKNKCPRTQNAPRGTKVNAANGVFYQTLNNVSLTQNESADVRVEACAGGAAGNLAAGNVSQISYPENLCIEVSQPEPIAGGDDGVFKGPSAADYQKALTIIARQAIIEAERQARQDSGDLRMILSDSIEVRQILYEKLTPDIGYRGESASLRQRLKVAVRTVNYYDMNAVIRATLSAQKMAGFIAIPNAMSYVITGVPKKEGRVISWTVNAEQEGYMDFDNGALQKAVAGLTTEKTERRLADMNLFSQPAQIRLFPNWIGRLPVATENIFIRIGEPESMPKLSDLAARFLSSIKLPFALQK